MDPEITLDAATRLAGFDKPVLLAWAPDDPLFPLADAHRLAGILPNARVETIADSRAFSMIDQPDALAALVAGQVARRPRPLPPERRVRTRPLSTPGQRPRSHGPARLGDERRRNERAST